MKCPICNETMMVDAGRGEIEIDCCPNCRGVWLDRGELDGLIEADGRCPRGAQARRAAPRAPR